jgi:beta-N-acetylhexosaminidase
MGLENRTRSIEDAVGQKMLLAFKGKNDIPGEVHEAIRMYRPAGFSLFRAFNIDHPAQVRELTQSLQRVAQEQGLEPFLIGVDQEGGQLMAIGEGVTLLPGNLALGAAGSPELAHAAGKVLGRELAAMGVNVDFAPSCDVNINPSNPVIGTRSFGENPKSVAALAAAMTAGIQASGVAATAKHFPGHGDTASDSHHGVPVVDHQKERLWQVELPPFQAAIQEDVKLVMSAHLSLPAVSGHKDVPSTLSPAILKGLLRHELGYKGVIVTDAMDMKAIQQGEGLGEDAVRAALAGCDLLLLTTNPEDHQRVFHSLRRAVQNGSIDPSELFESAQRVHVLKEWLMSQPPPPDLSVVGCASHHAVAAEVAARSITLIRDQAHILPLQLEQEQHLAVVMPQPLDLTPADTSSYLQPSLASVLRNYYPHVEEIIVPHRPQDQDIASVLEQIQGCQAVVLGTINAYSQPCQATLVKAVLSTNMTTILVAFRMPYDLGAFPDAPTYLCTYSLLDPCMLALAKVLCGETRAYGRLPVSIPGMYPVGYREEQ